MPTRTPTLDKAVRYPCDSGKELFPDRTKKKASEPEGPEAVIPVISQVALLCGDAETASGSTRQHQNTSSEASSRYSHSMFIKQSERTACYYIYTPCAAVASLAFTLMLKWYSRGFLI